MSKLTAHSKLPLGSAGFVEITIDASDIEHMADRDRKFILDVIDKLTAYAGVLVSLEPPVPEALRGLVGGRP